jgi:hypothetical protein
MARFKLTQEGWRNDTLDEVLSKSKTLRDARSTAGRLGGLSTSKHVAKTQANSAAKR